MAVEFAVGARFAFFIFVKIFDATPRAQIFIAIGLFHNLV